MKLGDILKTVIKEDTWGNNPSSGGSMSPGKTPNAVSPAPQANQQLFDVGKEYQNFEKTIEREEAAATKTLTTNVQQKLGGKKVLAHSSKGSPGQDQDYTIDVESVTVNHMGDKHYVILKGTDGKDYYLNTTHQVKVLGPAEKKKGSTPSQPPQQTSGVSTTGKKNVGGVVSPQNLGVGANKAPGA